MDEDLKSGLIAFTAIVIVIILFAATLPIYNVWRKELSGKADLKQTEWNRQIQVEEAQANLEAQKYNAKSEVERAMGVAEANKIIGQSLQNNSMYLHYLWLQGLHDGNSEIIYVPTEANLPIMEATRFLEE